MRTSPAPASSAAARSAAMPLPALRKPARGSTVLLMLLPSPRHLRTPHVPPSPDAVRLEVRTAAGRYTIEIAPGAALRLSALLDEARLPARRFIVSSPTVWRFHAGRVRRGAGRGEA